jgi:hypothetical protein
VVVVVVAVVAVVVFEISQNLLNGQNKSQKHWSCEATVSLAETMSAVPGPQDDFMLRVCNQVHFLFLPEPPVRNTWVVKHNLFNQKPSRSLRAYCNCSFLLQSAIWPNVTTNVCSLGTHVHTHIHTLAIVWHERLAVSLGSRIAL